MDIKVLGSGCVNCRNLEALVRVALDELGLDVDIEDVTDPGAIASWGVMTTPVLVIDGEVVAAGRIPPADRIKELLAAHGAR
jgi:small redox-active disulfide protein 2